MNLLTFTIVVLTLGLIGMTVTIALMALQAAGS